MGKRIVWGTTIAMGLFLLNPFSTCLAQSVGNVAFPPLPSAEELKPRDDAEKAAGVVVLDAYDEFSGQIEVQAAVKGVVFRTTRFRYLVLDEKGVERISRHAFFREGTPENIRVNGQTINPDGTVHALDPVRDLQTLDVRDVEGKSKNALRTCRFPHVTPGSVIDLAYFVQSRDLPEFEAVELQQEYPVRKYEVKVKGQLFKGSFWSVPLSCYWVPFFLGPVPPKCHANLDTLFNLSLTARDLPALPDESYAPSRLRTGYTLGVMPRIFPTNKKRSAEKWRQDLLLFGTDILALGAGPPRSFDQELSPAKAMVLLDGLGLQEVPAWSGDRALMTWWQESLGDISKKHRSFLSWKGETTALIPEVLQAAPANLPLEKRARALMSFVRAKVRPDPNGDDAHSLAWLLDRRSASERDLSLLYVFLCEKIGLPARMVIALSRYRLPFLPILESWRTFGASYLVEVGPAGPGAFYLMPGDAFADAEAMPLAYQGALAFRQPGAPESQWTMFRLPKDLPRGDRTEVTVKIPLDLEAQELQAAVHFQLQGAASYDHRWRLGWTRHRTEDDAVAQRMKKQMAALVMDWTGIPWEGAIPATDYRTNTESPYLLDVTLAYPSDIQLADGRVLAPAIRKADILKNYFVEESRVQPIWLFGGSSKMALTWVLPKEYRIQDLPSSIEKTGPQGLHFKMEFQRNDLENGGSEVTTTLALDVPDLLPAEEYAGVRAFFEELSRAAATRLVFLASEAQAASAAGAAP